MALRVPYDSLTMSAVVWELQPFIGAKIQRISQPDNWTVGIGLYSKDAGAGMLLLSCHAQFARAHLTTKRLPNSAQPPGFCAALRARLEGGHLVAVRQIDFDRILEIEIEHPSGSYRLIAELMGKHSNLMLVDAGKNLVAAAKWVGRSKSSRPIQPGGKYHRPPFAPKSPLVEASPGDDLREFAGASPFLIQLLEADPSAWERMRRCALAGEATPVLCPGHGAYPISVSALGLKEHARSSTSIALEQHFDATLAEHALESARSNLRSQLQRVLLAREVALGDLRQAEAAGGRAPEWQLKGELILAYGAALAEGAESLEAADYEGNPLMISLDPELDFKANANAFFERAKKAKGRLGLVRDQIARLEPERQEIASMIERAALAEHLREIEELYDAAKKRRWLHLQPARSAKKEDRPYEGNRVRELVAPGGWPIIYGENAESNDYLTLRVAKPNDWWLHVRGHVSAHVVIVTKNEPDKVGREALMFAARVAVQHSNLKHSGYVPVDYTLKKYVRKPRGGAKGTALYTHEKTLHVES